MSTAAVSSTSLSQQVSNYFQTRQQDLQQLGQALQSGDLAGAKAAYANIVKLGQSGPIPNGDPFRRTQREKDFKAIGQALQSGNLQQANEAFATLKSSFTNTAPPTNPPVSDGGGNAGSGAGPEIILNLSSGSSAGNTAPEHVTINISNTQGGGEQVSLSVSQQGAKPQRLTLNLGASSNEQIVLNFLNQSSSASAGANGGISVSA
jgi:hypothetical protein